MGDINKTSREAEKARRAGEKRTRKEQKTLERKAQKEEKRELRENEKKRKRSLAEEVNRGVKRDNQIVRDNLSSESSEEEEETRPKRSKLAEASADLAKRVHVLQLKINDLSDVANRLIGTVANVANAADELATHLYNETGKLETLGYW